MLVIRPVTGDDQLRHLARIASTVSPDNPTTVDELRWADAHYPGGARFLAWLDGLPVGTGGAGRVYMFPATFEGFWGNLQVLPGHRRHGAGSALLAAMSDHARASGKTMLIGRTTEDQPDGIAFLEHRGFEAYERSKIVRLDLAIDVPEVPIPEGIVLSSLEERPELAPGVWAVAKEALPDIPGDAPHPLETLEEFRVRDVDAPTIPAGGFRLAIDAVTGAVVGYASLTLVPGTPGLAWHDMTGVARSWRGRGVALALKRATIDWAIANGLLFLEGANDIDNAPMRAINRRLGYQPRPDEIGYRGPLAPPLDPALFAA